MIDNDLMVYLVNLFKQRIYWKVKIRVKKKTNKKWIQKWHFHLHINLRHLLNSH